MLIIYLYENRTLGDYKWIANPVNPEENFADKWIEHPLRENNFYKWLKQVRQDVHHIIQQRGIHNISDAMKKSFGESVVTKAFSAFGERNRTLRDSKVLKMAVGTGYLSLSGTVTVASHNYHGND